MKTDWRTWALLSAVFAALTALLAKLGVAQVPSHLATALRTTIVVAFAWSVAAAAGQVPALPAVGGRTFLYLGLSGLATGASWLCYFRALQLAPITKVAPLDKLSLPLALLLAMLFLGERLSFREGCGIVAVVFGTILLIGK
jgi:transporter family protein